MACLYSNFQGYCTLEEDISCCFEEDPNPTDGCENYESDNYCSDCGCGCDLNTEYCE